MMPACMSPMHSHPKTRKLNYNLHVLLLKDVCLLIFIKKHTTRRHHDCMNPTASRCTTTLDSKLYGELLPVSKCCKT